MRSTKKVLFALSLLISLFIAKPLVAQCPMCKANVESTIKGPGRKTGLGLNKGILMLLAMPYTAFAVVGILWYRNSKKKKGQGTDSILTE